MPRTSRIVESGTIYHLLNRGNRKMMLFRKPGDFDAFEKILAKGLERYPVDLLTWCLMGNHWHLVLRPRKQNAMGNLMRWVGVTHVRRHHAHHHTAGEGHIYQGRYKSFPVEEDSHFLTLCRYVEANPRRAKLVRQAQDWRWSRLGAAGDGGSILRAVDWPVERPRNWLSLVNTPLGEHERAAIQSSIARGRPLGSERWIHRAAQRLGLQYTLNPRGRPRLAKKE